MAHNNYYLDLCVDTFVVNKHAVLLRMHEKYHVWNAPGGHVDPGEDINEAALREVWEEVGLRVELVAPLHWEKKDFDFNKHLIPPMFVNRHRINDVHEHSSFVFAACSDSREINPQTEEDKGNECECVWLTQDDLDNLLKTDKRLRNDTHYYASAALALVAGN